MESDNKNKYDILVQLLSEGDAMVCLDARHSEVDVPNIHKDNLALSLVFNLNFRRPFDVQETGIQVKNKTKCQVIFMYIRNIHLRMPRVQANHRVTFT
jgi:hypothetical protein